MTASITDLISKVTSGTYAAPTTVQTARSSGTTSLLCNALTGWDTTTAQFFLTYRLDGSGKLVAGTECAWVGTVSGNTISSLTLTAGTDTGNQVGDVVVNLPTHEWARRIATHILTQHNQDGSHGVVTATSVTAPTITASTSLIVPDKAVTLPKINGGTTAGVLQTDASGVVSVTPMTLGYAQITSPLSSLSSTSNADLTGLTTTFTAPSGVTKVRIEVFSEIVSNSITGVQTIIFITLGDNTVLQRGRYVLNPANYGVPVNIVRHNYPVTPGASYTFKARYTVASGAGYLGADATYPAHIVVTAVG